MPPLNTDYFIKGARKLTTNLDSSGISDAVVDNFGLTSTAGFATDTPCVITVDRVDSNGNKTPAKEEGILGIVSGSTIVSAIRGFEGTAQAHSAGAVVEVRLLSKQWERLINGILVAHEQTGEHKLSKLDGVRYAADAGGDDTYEITLSPAPAAYYAGMEISFKPSTANTGACTLNVNGLGAKTIKKSVNSDLATGDILAGQMVTVKYDGTNFQIISQLGSGSGGGSAVNLVKNGNFINNSGNGYGLTPDDWSGSNANQVQGGIPALTKQNTIDLLGVADGEIEGLWNLNGNFNDLSSSGYNLTPTNSPADSSDGLMAQCKDFESGSSQYASIADASCPNLEIAGSQTWFAFVKPESLTASIVLMGKLKNTASANGHQFYIEQTTGKAVFQLGGLTTNTNVKSDVALQTGKWYLVAGVYDSANSALRIYVNGVLSSVTASGSAGDSNSNFAIGCNFSGGSDAAADFFDGMVQNAGVLSVALTQDQLNRLFAATLYKGIKLRRASGTDAVLSQSLPQALVERLRGKNVSITAKAYQDSASTAIVSIDDGTDTESDTNAITGSFQEIGKTKSISATAVAITLKLKVKTTDSSAWFKEVLFYEGSNLVYTWSPSQEDMQRFPRLMRMDFPKMVGFYPYQYEENRHFSTFVDGPTNTNFASRAMFSGKHCEFSLLGTLTGVPSWTNMPTIPIRPSSNMPVTETDYGINGVGGYLDNGTANKILGIVAMIGSNSTVRLRLDNVATSSIVSATNPITWASGDVWWVKGSYEID